MSLTQHLIDLSALPSDQLPGGALALARFSLLDWMACGIAGKDEPVARKLRAFAETEGGAGNASLIGAGVANARMAALVNGTTSHALDYDDTHFAHVGHLSVGIYPAALAVAEEIDASASELVEAFLTGAEAAIRVGIILAPPHYNAGFHQTATAGAFGATIAAARLLGLEPAEMRNAISLCSTRASGLKSQFGTMGKPYNAGIAASNGVECPKLAALGMISADIGLEGGQGFIATHTPAAEPFEHLPPLGQFLFEDNKYKLHACCHGTHAMIEALLDTPKIKEISLDDIASLTLHTNPRWLKVCDNKSPRTGLEVKFSYNWLAGMTIRGDSTGDDRIYSDALATDAELQGFASRVSVTAADEMTDTEARGTIGLKDGSAIDFYHDLAARIPEKVLEEKLRAKAEAAIGARGTALWDRFSDLAGIRARDIGRALTTGN